tara:strand:+ start:1341 stop:1805 length:465 start_codon:yes stop_codon:yes gene_type:complete
MADNGFYDTSDDDAVPQKSEEAVAASPEPNDLAEFVRALVQVDDEIKQCKKQMSPFEIRIKELKQKYNKLRVIVGNIMEENNIDTLEPEINGHVVAKLTLTTKKRSRPTMKALEQAVLDNVFNGDDKRLDELRQSALANCPPTGTTLRCTRRTK